MHETDQGMDRLKQELILYPASEWLQEYAVQAAHSGVERIETRLSIVDRQAQKRNIGSSAASTFLGEATLELWEIHRNLEPIMVLYEKYYNQKSGPADSEVTVGEDFSNVMAQIAASEQGIDRQLIINSANRFIIRHNDDIADRRYELSHFALELIENGAEKEGVFLGKLLLLTSSPDIVRELCDLKEAIKKAESQ